MWTLKFHSSPHEKVTIWKGWKGLSSKPSIFSGPMISFTGVLPSRELTYPIKNGILKMIFLFPRWDMLVPWRGKLHGGIKPWLSKFSTVLMDWRSSRWRARGTGSHLVSLDRGRNWIWLFQAFIRKKDKQIDGSEILRPTTWDLYETL